ncbi:TrlF family AAA-like ATPase [Capnocytophaga catalasegens]|uniref:DNA repair ATPase n=1 Tax=Capnocytophaga catalasegens TaxID=1004260 RepID=A0AAV5B101_9FLAO|nr:hypothetical protein [Capnocytophaga catalasegens]GIZ16047.1 DNA repair ATPase [Capnocytophaga catalasegens]GJM51247.1 DNA repair ATPase [Capnocytophaga catalasegens]GJM53329.1 DNA repair ATPase [Capnocytophaga catalasegens]
MTTNIAINRGSEWRKWDLHIHTPLSICQDYGGDSEEVWENFITSLEQLPHDVKVIGITDYYFIDGYEKIMEYKFKRRLSNIFKIFPILEFRIDTFGSGNENKLQKINLHILFNIDENDIVNELKTIREEFIDQIKISSLETHITKKLSKENFISIAGNLQAGFNSLIPSTKEVLNIIRSDTWKNKVFLFLGYKEWSNLDKNQQIKPLKEDLYSKVGAFFSSNANNVEKNQQWLNEFGNKRLLHSLDIHNFNDLKKENYCCHTWIKADLTFEGLKQIIYEPEERVKIQENKPEEKSGYQVIDRIEIYHQDFQEKKENEETIEEYKTIFLNPNLNTIIGGRSTGKSILLGAIAKKLNSDKDVKLDNTEYSQYIDEIVSSMKIFWKDGDENSTRDIEYFPQSYMYQLAKDSNELNKLVKNIIIQDANKKTKIEAYQSFSSDNNSKIIEDINKLFKAKSTIDSIQKSMTEIGDKEGVTKEKEKLSTELESLKAKIQITSNELISYSNLKNEYDKNISSIREIEQQKISLSALKSLSIINDISLNLIDLTEDIRDQVNRVYLDLKQRYSEEWNEKIETILAQKETEIVRIKDRNESIEKDELYLKGKSVIDSNQQYKEKEEKYKIENSKLEKITELEKQRDEYDNFINSLKSSIIENSKKYYTELQRIQNELSVSSGRLKITATINTDFPKYKNILYSSINQQGVQGKQIIEKSINTTQELFEDISSMFELLLSNSITLKGGYDNQKLIKELLGTNFFNISYEIEYDTDKFKAMSEGKKAFIILMLLLDFSKKECPILIDQPEDDLDNRAIYNELVTYIKSKKKERQIIIVTHNSNIVIGADSELVIVSNQQGVNSPNKNNRKFDYIFGSIESSMEKDNTISEILYSQGIRQHICEILEGGETAFKNREKKYGF